jgi:hypothetical protein
VLSNIDCCEGSCVHQELSGSGLRRGDLHHVACSIRSSSWWSPKIGLHLLLCAHIITPPLSPAPIVDEDVATKKSNVIRIGPITRAHAKLLEEHVNYF